MTRSILAAAIALSVAAGAVEAQAAAFSAWQITNVPWGDTLNVRKYPANHSQKQSAYPNGTILQMTGRCTGGLDLLDISGSSDSAQKAAVRYLWCEVWHDPRNDGDFTTGWVYGKYIRPY